MNDAPNPRHDPECDNCGDLTHVRELIIAPFEGERQRWCPRCVDDFYAELERRAAEWEERWAH